MGSIYAQVNRLELQYLSSSIIRLRYLSSTILGHFDNPTPRASRLGRATSTIRLVTSNKIQSVRRPGILFLVSSNRVMKAVGANLDLDLDLDQPQSQHQPQPTFHLCPFTLQRDPRTPRRRLLQIELGP